MATYTQGCSSVGGYSYAKNFTLYVVLSNRNGDSNINKSWVDYNVYCQSSGSGSLSAKQKLYFEINGQTVRDSIVDINVKSPNAYIGIASGSIQVAHNNDGTKTIGFSASISASAGYGLSASKSDNFTLNKIDRYAYFSKCFIDNKTINSVNVRYRPDRWISQAQYQINNWGWKDLPVIEGNWNNPNNDVVYKVGGLNPNTNYEIETRIQYQNVLWTYSGKKAFRTYDIAKIKNAPNFNDEENPKITYENPSENRVTKLQACISLDHKSDNIKYRDINRTGKEYTFNLTESERKVLRSACKNKNSLTVYFYLKTILGSDTYYNNVQRTMSIVNANPTFNNFTYKDIDTNIVNNLTGNNQAIVKGYSNIEATISVANRAIAKKEASMVKYRLSVQNQSVEAKYSSSQNVIMKLNDIKTGTFTVYAIDSRNNSTSKQLSTGNFIDYNPIVIKSIKLTRTNNVTSETILNFNGYFWNGNFGKVTNTITECYYEYRVTGTSNWTRGQTTITLTKSGNSFSYNDKIIGDLGASGFDVNKSFEIRVIISDRLSNNKGKPASFILGSGTPAIAIYKNKVAIGGKYNTAKGGDMQITGEDIINYVHGYKAIRNLPKGSDNRDYWNHLPGGIYWYGNTGAVANMPSSWGFAFKMGFEHNGDFNILYFQQSSGAIWRKSGNSDFVSGWVRVSEDTNRIVVLYENQNNAINTSVTLNNDLLKGIKYIEIFMRIGSPSENYARVTSGKIEYKNNNRFSLFSTLNLNKTLYLYSSKYQIVNNVLKYQEGALKWFYNTEQGFDSKSSNIAIIKVLGYK